MNLGKRLFFFLSMLILTGSMALLLTGTRLTECVSVLRTGEGMERWDAVGCSGEDLAAAVRRTDGGAEIRTFSPDGRAVTSWVSALPDEYAGGCVAAVAPVSERQIILGVYTENARELALFRLTDGGDPELLLTETCPGDTYAERTAGTWLSGFYRENGTVSFALLKGGSLCPYLCQQEGGLAALDAIHTQTDSLRSALVLPDGIAALGGNGFLTVGGQAGSAVRSGESVRSLTRGRVGWYYLDAASLTVCFANPAEGAGQTLFSLKDATGDRQLTDYALGGNERAVLLLDGTGLFLADGQGIRQINGVLSPTKGACAGTLALICVAVLFAAAVLWFLFTGARRGHTPMAIYRGATLIALALLCSVVLRFGVLRHESDALTARMNADLCAGAVRMASGGEISGALPDVPEEREALRLADSAFTRRICLALENAGGYRNVRCAVARRSNAGWTLSDGTLARSLPFFSEEDAKRILSDGNVCRREGDAVRYTAFLNGAVVVIRAENPEAPDIRAVERTLFAALALLTALAVLMMLVTGRSLHTLARQVERVSMGQTSFSGRARLRTGDEVESLASAIYSLAASLEEQKSRSADLEHSYRRFVPEKILSLLGTNSIREVTKQTFSSRHMAVMAISFVFPEQVYTNTGNSRLLFDSVNAVIERTASIVAQKGGTVFNFAYNGYDVVMEKDPRQVLSTAIAIEQEILSFNESRNLDGLPPVRLSIAVDEGDVMLGIVGDSTQMEPTTISSSFSVVRELLRLCEKLDARILCTEDILSGASRGAGRDEPAAGSRYMGKCTAGGSSVRVYEVFDGDAFQLRQAKAGSVSAFTQALLALYSGDAASAKKQFLLLAHSTPDDGGARFYLYLSDALEQDPTLPCELNTAPGRA